MNFLVSKHIQKNIRQTGRTTSMLMAAKAFVQKGGNPVIVFLNGCQKNKDKISSIMGDGCYDVITYEQLKRGGYGDRAVFIDHLVYEDALLEESE